ncbi:serine protease [Spirulina sp. CS-785/01]|uniref:S1 family peptidase n=1 Tax=Spirulina sp. CS-785/01 TaxID=3021716 RepID=UPI00232E4B9B|nr:serine protease [Spirulina sp. CS-785/01]MDB9312117.1 serine protease [Spirulina sp. CS-785/01]
MRLLQLLACVSSLSLLPTVIGGENLAQAFPQNTFEEFEQDLENDLEANDLREFETFTPLGEETPSPVQPNPTREVSPFNSNSPEFNSRPQQTPTAPPPQVSQNLQTLAQAVSVKVLAGRVWGSGVLIQQQGNVYTVVTNEHVLAAGLEDKSYQVQTPDGQIHRATVRGKVDFSGNDVSVLRFRSPNSYTVVSLAPRPPQVGDAVFAAGFPLESNTYGSGDFTLTAGEITFVMARPFIKGYQLGYSNDVVQGMSGGPLLNGQGQLIGINGKHKYPLWGNPYVFSDGSTPNQIPQEELARSSWAIPLQTILQMASIAPDSRSAQTPSPSSPTNPPASFSRPNPPQVQPRETQPTELQPLPQIREVQTGRTRWW